VFRKEVYISLQRKGIIPPLVGSDQETILFSQWLKGKKRIKSYNDTF